MMRRMSLSELSPVLEGTLHGDASFERVDIDSRATGPGAVFVALCGEHFDGHDYVSEAARKEVKAAIVSKTPDTNVSYLRVRDTHQALGRMGAFNRTLFQKPVVAITGSSGKTTCKDMIATILDACYRVYATPNNQNNEVGVPLSLLNLNANHQAAVIELAARALGEIGKLAEWTQPNIALLTNAQRAHMRGFGSKRNVMKGKGELLAYVQAGGVAVLPHGREEYDYWRKLCGTDIKILRFGLDADADVYIEQHGTALTLHSGVRSVPLVLNVLGVANRSNAAAAAAVAVALNIDLDTVATALRNFQGAAGRLQLLHTAPTLIDDSYNANPDSTRAAIDALAGYSGRRLLIFGDMADLGDLSQRYHEDIGAYAREKGIQYLWCCGEWARYSARAFGENALHYETRDDMLDNLQDIKKMDAILVKGSRISGMELIVANALKIITDR